MSGSGRPSSGRVVVTGLGAVTPLGTGIDRFWPRLLAGESGIRTIEGFDASPYATRIAGEVSDFEPGDFMDRKEARRLDRTIQFALAAAKMALDDSGLEITEELQDEIGVYVGSGIGGLQTMHANQTALAQKGPDKVSPFWIPYMIANMSSGMISIAHGLRGPNVAAVTACATGINAIGDAYHVIRRGEAVAMVAGGSEAAINDLGVAGFCAARAMSTRNDEPTRACRPWDKGRDGFVMGEGSGIVILEDYDFAVARGARIYGEVVGYGQAADAYHLTAPHPEAKGATSAMTRAFRTTGVDPASVDYLNAHGTSTGLGDVHETVAVKQAFGIDNAKRLAISSTKSMIGHLLGGAGAVESVICLLAMRDGVVPPTINLEDRDDECDLDYVPLTAREMRVDVAMNNGFGFGGHNASLLFRKVEGR